MASFDMSYDADEDVLEATFAVFEERLSRSIALNDHIFVFTDLMMQVVWGLTFYSYSRLLLVSETEFTALKEVEERHVEALLALLSTPPASFFFDLTDPEALIARVLAPRLDALVRECEE